MASKRMPKGSTIIHAGLPKCATSSIQRLFLINDYKLSRELQCVYIGKSFKPFNGYPPVSEILYDCGKCIGEIAENLPKAGMSFLSSEALTSASRNNILAAIQRKSHIARVVFTVRYPVSQALSNFAYSGWLFPDRNPFNDKNEHLIINAHARHRRLFREFSEKFHTVLVPIEPRTRSLLNRFVRDVFFLGDSSECDKIECLHLDAYSESRAVNQSMPLGLAMALSDQIAEHGVCIESRAASRILKSSFLACLKHPKEVSNILPRSLPVNIEASMDSCAIQYASILADFGVPDKEIEESIKAAKDSIIKIRDMDTSSSNAKVLNDYAHGIWTRLRDEVLNDPS